MGSLVSKAANGIGEVLGNVLAAPFKSIFSDSCEQVCSGPWDVICFIEHLCVSNLIKLLMILCLCYLLLLFFYLLFKLGICQCIVRSLCKICCAACETYWFALEDITCCLWYKLKNTKRVNRRRRRSGFQDLEWGNTSSSESNFSERGYHHLNRKRKLIRERRKLSRHGRHHHHHHHFRLKSREVSVHVKGKSRRLRNSRQLQLVKARNHHRDHPEIFKRPRLR